MTATTRTGSARRRASAAASTLLVAAGSVLGLLTGCDGDDPLADASVDDPAATAPAAPAAPASRPRGDGPAPEDPAPREASLLFGGDLLWHDTVWLSAEADAAAAGASGLDLDPMFADLRGPVRAADLAVCHEEVPFAAPGAAYQSYPVFAAPPAIAGWLGDFGWDACVTTSNHSLDQGYDGLVRTADLLDAAGVRPVGTFRSAAERRRPVVLTTDDGVRVGLVAGTYGLNGFPLPEGREWSVSLWDAENLLAQARAARDAGADVVVVALHGGTEYDHLPNADQVALVDRLTRSPDVDLVVGEHAHVVQPVTKVNGTWVAYGMGNMVAQQEATRPATYQGIAVEFTFTERPGGGFAVSEAAYLPISWGHWPSAGPLRVRRVVAALERTPGDPGLLAARRDIAAAVHGLGRTPGLVER
ncbi:CapA family protein [Nocardioides ferulae]|uniref:CapA family protein n=1 Tax=Nocardioides ferulae TaxID=2340821 RepID=UPI000EAD83F1|nr:CapA family protein [Nocardioides ferulae]